MKIASRSSIIFAVALLAATFSNRGQASAETIIRAIYHIVLPDSATGVVLSTGRRSIVSWPKMDQCKAQNVGRADFHVKAVEGYGFKNSDGKAFAVKLFASNCIVVSE